MSAYREPRRWAGSSVAVGAVLAAGLTGQSPAESSPITTITLLDELSSLERLTRLPDPDYRTVQWSSYDRRSRGVDRPDWFGNADGFGREPVPGFAAVVRTPGPDGVGEFLLGACDGPGAIVRTWSAGMAGTLRVVLDGDVDAPLFVGRADDFLRRKTAHLLAARQSRADTSVALMQNDADYLPIPFAESLRMTWTGKLDELHFYQVQVRRYAASARVVSFGGTPQTTLDGALARTRQRLLEPDRDRARTTDETWGVGLASGRSWSRTWRGGVDGGAFERLVVRLDGAEDRSASGRRRTAERLRGTLLEIAFDGSETPQVQAPLGDLFGTGPGLNVHESLPLSVGSDGTLTCRFVMPYRESATVRLTNHVASGLDVGVQLGVDAVERTFDERSLHFRARWRADRELTALGGAGPIDLPFVMLRGAGRFVGCAVMLANPSPTPTPGGNWWGEGDEKVFVDDEPFPSTFGTGSEDYFNYSWSRPDLFAYAFCGQPLTSGPGTAGWVSNHRFQIVDDLPFERFLAFGMELRTHHRVEHLAYDRLAYVYARPGAIDDHRSVAPSELTVPPLRFPPPQPWGGAANAEFAHVEDLLQLAAPHVVQRAALPEASRGRVVEWHAQAGERWRIRLPVARLADWKIHFVAVEQPGGAVVRARLGDTVLRAGASDVVSLDSEHAVQLRSIGWDPLELAGGAHVLELEAVTAGRVALDYAWLKPVGTRIEHAVEAETLPVLGASDGVTWVDQRLGARWSRGRHLWVKAREIGDRIDVAVPVPATGAYRVSVRFTSSYDYGVVRVSLGGDAVSGPISTYAPRLGVDASVQLADVQATAEDGLRLRFELVGVDAGSRPPHTYFGIDCIVLEPLR